MKSLVYFDVKTNITLCAPTEYRKN